MYHRQRPRGVFRKRINPYCIGIKTIMSGRATTNGTKNFMNSSNWPFHHHFQRSNLYINPIIHGPPKFWIESSDTEEIDRLAKALLHNRSNCIVVYDHRNGKPWYCASLFDLLANSEDLKIKREEIVTVAGLGVISSPRKIRKTIEEASKLTMLETIDIGIIEFTDSSLRYNIELLLDSIQEMEDICAEGLLSSYGIKLDLPPFIYHNPPLTSGSNFMTLPALTEEYVQNNCKYADLMLYTISPSHAVPATYPMLVDREVYADEEALKAELGRKFSRAACDPFVCLPGRGNADNDDDEKMKEIVDKAYFKEDNTQLPQSNSTVSYVADEEVILVDGVMPEDLQSLLRSVLDNLCPALKSTPKLEDKALRVVFSVGIDAVVVDSELSAAIGPLTLTPKDLLDSSQTDDVFGEFMIPQQQIT